MKKKPNLWEFPLPILKKLMMELKIAFLIIVASVSNVFATTTYSQVAKVSLDMKNTSLEQVMDEIESQSEFYFIFNQKQIDVNRVVDIREDNKLITEILPELFQGTNVNFMVLDRKILLTTDKIENNLLDIASESGPQQKKLIAGIVTDKSGAPLAGVNVVVTGTTRGMITDISGKYSIEVSPEDKSLTFSFIGMQQQEVAIGTLSQINITMAELAIGLDEIVVVAYGTQKKSSLTGSVSTINFEAPALTSKAVVNASTALAGLAPGMLVNQNNGSPSNNAATIKIRGTGSLNQGSDAFVIIDGNPGDMNSINPNDIASFSVLKDAASAAIYGSRAANGVILITTKTGSNSGKVVFDYNGYVGRIAPTKLFDILTDVGDHMMLVNLIERNSGLAESFTQERIDEWRTNSKTDPILYPNTNWYEEIIRPNILTSNTFSARGGNEKLNFYTSFGILDNSGLVPKSGVTRYNLRNNLVYKVNNWLTLGNILTGNFKKYAPDLSQSLFIVYPNPSVLPRHPDGRYGGAMSGGIDTQAGNLLEEIDGTLGETAVQNYTGKLYAIVSPISGLSITGSYFTDITNSDSWGSGVPLDRWDFQNEFKLYDSSVERTGVGNGFSKYTHTFLDIYATYEKTFGNHNLRFMAGFNQEKYDGTWFNASKLDLISINVPKLDAASTQPAASGSGDAYRMRSYFGRLNYTLANKYLFEANIRYDGSSRFAPENRWGVFPSFSAGWIASKESFWEPLAGTVDYFKIRASYGSLGNNNIGNYAWQNVYGAHNYSFGNSIVQGLTPTANVNYNIQWEITDVMDIGVDLELFKKVNITLEYYNKFSHGVLAQLPIPYINGTMDDPYTNAAEIRNTGVEYDIRYNAQIGKLGINIGTLGAFNKNRIEKYKGEGVIDEVGDVGAWTEGQPIGKFRIFEVDHIIQEQSELDNLVSNGYTWDSQMPGVGDFLMKDSNGDKIFNDDDLIMKGNPIPLFTYAFNLNLKYEGFDFYALINGVAKVDKYLWGYSEGLQAMIGGYGYTKRWLDSWTPENKSTTIPKIYTNNDINNGSNDYFLCPGDYLRVKTIQLGYSLPQKLVNKAKLSKVRIYLNLENYLQFTKYRGMDPEADGSVGMSEGSNPTNTYPLMKTASLGLNFGF
jgi:TonB-linked SusC/RagA family outer membrane protein